MMRWDTTIIGGGIIGCSAALHLAKRGLRVALLERRGCGREASGVNAGTLVAQNKSGSLLSLVLHGLEQWKRMDAEDPVLGYHRNGGWRVAQDEEQAVELAEAVRLLSIQGVKAQLYCGAKAREHCPALGAITAATYCDLDGYADALVAVDRLRRAATANGCTIMENTPVSAIEPHASGWSVTLPAGQLFTRQVILAAGVWNPGLLAPLGWSYPLEIKTNQMAVTQPVPLFLPHVITHARGNLTLKQVPAGSVLVGGGWQGASNFAANRKGASLASLVGNLTLACRVIPRLAQTSIIRSWAGFEGVTPDRLPVVGEVPGYPGLHLAASGFCGFTVGLFLGHQVAKLIAGESHDYPGISAFRPGRFARVGP